MYIFTETVLHIDRSKNVSLKFQCQVFMIFSQELDDLVDTARRNYSLVISRSSHPEVYLEKSALKLCSKSTGEHPCQSVTSIKCFATFPSAVYSVNLCDFETREKAT